MLYKKALVLGRSIDINMQFFRNPEIKRVLSIYIIFTLLAVVGAMNCNVFVAIYVFVVCFIALLLFLLFTIKRYQDISYLSGQLDRILHGEERTNFAPDKEGELALLSSEIYKMTVRLQEQSELLQKEKNYLSSSIEDISHQIRTPLTSIRMIVPRLRREELSKEQKNEYVQEIIGLLSRIEWLVTALLKMARLESGTVVFEKYSIGIKDLITKAFAPLEILAEIKELSLEMVIPPDISFHGDFNWSVEAIVNILKNCIEHTPCKGGLKIEAAENPIYTEIIITDTGPGIPSKDLPHLFDRFYKGN